MKMNSFLKVLVTSLILFMSTVVARAESVKVELLHDIQIEVQKCAVPLVQNTNEVMTVIGYKSKCSTLQVISKESAKIFIDGQWYSAKIAESKESDGGDLDDLFIFDSKGTLVAKRINVPAYDNVVLAMGRSKK
jgi:hypothetical protein